MQFYRPGRDSVSVHVALRSRPIPSPANRSSRPTPSRPPRPLRVNLRRLELGVAQDGLPAAGRQPRATDEEARPPDDDRDPAGREAAGDAGLPGVATRPAARGG